MEDKDNLTLKEFGELLCRYGRKKQLIFITPYRQGKSQFALELNKYYQKFEVVDMKKKKWSFSFEPSIADLHRLWLEGIDVEWDYKNRTIRVIGDVPVEDTQPPALTHLESLGLERM